MTEEPLDGSPKLDGLADSEDLFDFDARSTPSQESDLEGSAADDGDDLFDFDEILALEHIARDEVDVEAVLAELPSTELTPRDRSLEPDKTEPSPPSTPAEHAAPAALPARLSLRSPVAWMLIAFAAINFGLIGFTWKLSNDVRDRVDAATVDILQATRSIQEKTGQQIERIESTQKPLVSPEPEGSETFRRVEEDVAAGNYGSARRRLYALLAVSDRLGAEFREDLVARAEFRLADTLMAQALASGEGHP